MSITNAAAVPEKKSKGAPENKTKGPARLNINISSEEALILQRLSGAQDTSVTNIVRRAIQIYDYLDRHLSDEQTVLQMVNKEKNEVTTLAIV